MPRRDDVLLGLRVSREEAALIRTRAAQSNQSITAFMRYWLGLQPAKPLGRPRKPTVVPKSARVGKLTDKASLAHFRP